jgi:hypothetical protein
MKLAHLLVYVKTLALVAWICVADQSRGLRDDQKNELPGISEVTASAAVPEASSQGSDIKQDVKELIVKDDVNKQLTAANNVTSLIKLVGSSVLDHRDLQANPEQCSALTVNCGPTKTCASIGFPGLCCSKWGVSTLFDVPLFVVPNLNCTQFYSLSSIAERQKSIAAIVVRMDPASHLVVYTSCLLNPLQLRFRRHMLLVI